MEQRVLNIELREQVGKGISRRLRKIGKVPAVVYGKGMDAVPGTVSVQELKQAIAGEGGRNNLITLKGSDALDGKLVIVADITRDCLKGTLIHVDLHKINLEDKVRVPVSVNLVGTAAGVKEGGMLDFSMHTIEIECLPTEIPEHIDVDVTSLAIGDSLHVGDIKLPAGVKVLEDSMAAVVNILGKPKEEAAPVEEAGA